MARWSGRFGVALTLAAVVVTGCSSNNKGDPQAFCTASSQAQQLGTEIQSLSVDNTEAVKLKVHAAAQAADSAASKAPKEIRSSARALADALDSFDQRVAAAKDAAGLTTAFTDFTTAANRLGSDSTKLVGWVGQHCPASSNPPASVAPTTTTTTVAPSTTRATSTTTAASGHTTTTRPASTTTRGTSRSTTSTTR
jgi:outer membrane murein-binding lipoprotein Lpp